MTGYEFVVLRAHLNTDWGGEKRTTAKHYFIERSEVEEDLDMFASGRKEILEVRGERQEAASDTSGNIKGGNDGIKDYKPTGRRIYKGDPLE